MSMRKWTIIARVSTRGFATGHAPALLSAQAIAGLRALGINDVDSSGTSLFEAQRACWPMIDKGLPTFLAAPTGTGKSVLAVLRACIVAGQKAPAGQQGPSTHAPNASLALPRTIVIAPTRELAMQHFEVALKMLPHTAPGASATLIAGGEKHALQRKQLAASMPELVVGTPGRLLAHVAQCHLSLHKVRCVVVDEADCLLAADGGYWLELRQLLQLLNATPAGRKDAKDAETLRARQQASASTAQTSGTPSTAQPGLGELPPTSHATLAIARPRARPPRVQLLFTAATADSRTLSDAAELSPGLTVPVLDPSQDSDTDGSAGLSSQAASSSVADVSPQGNDSSRGLPAAALSHEWIKLLRPGDSKMRELAGRVKAGCAPTLVFTNSMASCMAVWRSLWERGLEAARVHGGMEPEERDNALHKLRTKAACVLVTTDVVMRGLDLPAVARVINFDFPESAQQFVHRVGRTGRAGKKGSAIHFIGSHADWLLARQLRDPLQLQALLAAPPPLPAGRREQSPDAPEALEPDASRGVPEASRGRSSAAARAAAKAAAEAEADSGADDDWLDDDDDDHPRVGRGLRASSGSAGGRRAEDVEREGRAPRAVGGTYSMRGEAGRGRVVLRARGRRQSESDAASELESAKGADRSAAGAEPLRFVRSAYTPSLRSARRSEDKRSSREPVESEYRELRFVELSASGEPLHRVERVRHARDDERAASKGREGARGWGADRERAGVREQPPSPWKSSRPGDGNGRDRWSGASSSRPSAEVSPASPAFGFRDRRAGPAATQARARRPDAEAPQLSPAYGHSGGHRGRDRAPGRAPRSPGIPGSGPGPRSQRR